MLDFNGTDCFRFSAPFNSRLGLFLVYIDLVLDFVLCWLPSLLASSIFDDRTDTACWLPASSPIRHPFVSCLHSASLSPRGAGQLFRSDHMSVIDGHFDAFGIAVDCLVHRL